MSESKSSELPLSETPYKACHATKEELLRSGKLETWDDCLSCAAYGTRCLVSAHPLASAGNGYSTPD